MNIKEIAKEVASQVFHVPQLDSETTAWLVLDGKEYELREFSTEFGQGIDHKGQPQHEIKGGLLNISLYQIPDETLNRWMLRSGERKNGEIQFRKKTSNTSLRIRFVDAQCVGYTKIIGRNDIGLEAKLTLSPKEIYLNDTMHRNEWK